MRYTCTMYDCTHTVDRGWTEYNLHTLGVDIMDLPRTERGNKHVIVFQDFLTKWPIVFPMPEQKTLRIVRLLVEEIIPCLVYQKPYFLIKVPIYSQI